MRVFITVMSILIPVTMIILGHYFRIRMPKKINFYFGYRTNMSTYVQCGYLILTLIPKEIALR